MTFETIDAQAADAATRGAAPCVPERSLADLFTHDGGPRRSRVDSASQTGSPAADDGRTTANSRNIAVDCIDMVSGRDVGRVQWRPGDRSAATPVADEPDADGASRRGAGHVGGN